MIEDLFMVFAILVLAGAELVLAGQLAELKRSVELYPSVMAKRLLEAVKKNDGE